MTCAGRKIETLDDLHRLAFELTGEAFAMDQRSRENGPDEPAILELTRRCREAHEWVKAQDWSGYHEPEPLVRYPTAAWHFHPRPEGGWVIRFTR